MTTNDSEMSEQDDCKAATPEELCEGALRHYDEISTKACHWMNTIPQAIRFWYLERPKLLASLEQKAVPQDVSSSIGSSTRNQAERERRVAAEKLAAFGATILEEHRGNECSDLDGGYVQDTAINLGLLHYVPVTESCGEGCRCAEWDDFPQECLRIKPDVLAIMEAQKP